MKRFACLFAFLAALSITGAKAHAACRQQEPAGRIGDDTEGKDASFYLDEAEKCQLGRNWPGMLDNLGKALKMEPDNVKTTTRAWTEFAWLANELGDYDSALKGAVKAIQIDPQADRAWCEAGYSLLKTKVYDQAVQALKIAIHINPGNQTARNYLKEALEQRDEQASGNPSQDVANRTMPKMSTPNTTMPKMPTR